MNELMKYGSELTAEDRKHVLAAYLYRYTGSHKPNWASNPWKDGQPYPVQFSNDQDWLSHTLFHVTKSGRLNYRKRECLSSPTWPFNPELRKPNQ